MLAPSVQILHALASRQRRPLGWAAESPDRLGRSRGRRRRAARRGRWPHLV